MFRIFFPSKFPDPKDFLNASLQERDFGWDSPIVTAMFTQVS